jgi:phosphoglycolate phosphatase-like HAD superfamily hydrolase
MTTLLLWDIDGTLIDSSGAGMRALATALRKTFSINGSTDGVEYAGRTDRWIMRQIFAKYDLPASPENFDRYADGYIAVLPDELGSSACRVLPGVRDLLEASSCRPGVAQGLLTGNIRRGAQVKLGHHGLWDYFPFGAFADDSEQRNDLGPHALRRARERHGSDFPPSRTWIIGDTPHDIACARAIGARALAVGTGQHSVEELGKHAPDALLPDLADAAGFWEIIEAAP